MGQANRLCSKNLSLPNIHQSSTHIVNPQSLEKFKISGAVKYSFIDCALLKGARQELNSSSCSTRKRNVPAGLQVFEGVPSTLLLRPYHQQGHHSVICTKSLHKL